MFDEPVVVHYKDGRTLRGFGENFLPADRDILVRSLEGAVVTVPLSDVKVVCFVRSHATDGLSRHRHPAALLFQGVPGRRVVVLFKDGERLEGIAAITETPKSGFFLTPLNPESNNLQVFVNPDGVASLQFPTPATSARA
jgi:hypothetical protein